MSAQEELTVNAVVPTGLTVRHIDLSTAMGVENLAGIVRFLLRAMLQVNLVESRRRRKVNSLCPV